MHIDKYKRGDGYEAPNGSFYECAEDFLQSHVLGFCNCGRPEESLRYVRDALQHIDNLKQLVWEKKQTHEEWEADGKKVFANAGAEYFAYYVLSEKGFEEHGGSVPGWLTDKGRELLDDLNKCICDEELLNHK